MSISGVLSKGGTLQGSATSQKSILGGSLAQTSIKGNATSRKNIFGDASTGLSVSGQVALGEAARLPRYEGTYSVTPSAHEAQTLNTAKKYLEEDVNVKKIPYSETSNTSGGNTVYIGNEV
jgi:hypothetical protein